MSEPFPYDPSKRRLGEVSGSFESVIDGEPAWTLDFHYHRDPIPMNGSRGSHRAHAKKVRGVQLRTWRNLQLAAIPTLDFCQVQLTWYVTTRGRRDVENLGYTLKAMCDAVVKFGVVVDDVPALMKKHQNQIIRVNPQEHGEPWMELTIRPWQGLGADLLTTQ